MPATLLGKVAVVSCRLSPAGPDLPREEKFTQVKGSQPRPKVSGPRLATRTNSKVFRFSLSDPCSVLGT